MQTNGTGHREALYISIVGVLRPLRSGYHIIIIDVGRELTAPSTRSFEFVDIGSFYHQDSYRDAGLCQ